MPLKVLIVPDKFKGTLTAQAAAELIAQGWRQIRAEDSVELLPMTDGGDGFGEVLSRLLSANLKSTPTIDAAHRPINAAWWWEPNRQMALIESARVIGLALLPPKQYHPFDLDTAGLNAVIQAALDSGAKRLLIGIGGSATNDGGFGLAKSLNWAFVDQHQKPIEKWTELDSLKRIIPPPQSLARTEITVAVDVQNPLLGEVGASRIYGPQKGLRSEDMPHAEACLGRLADVVQQDLGIMTALEPGAGAAGGLGFGLRTFLNARVESGFKLFAQYACLEERIRAAQLVITGEGAIDVSTLMGKGVGEVASLCRNRGVPCVGIAGAALLSEEQRLANDKFHFVRGIAPELTSAAEAKQNPSYWLPRLAAEAATEWTERNGK